MGTVFRGEDVTTGHWWHQGARDLFVHRPDSLRRFYKEGPAPCGDQYQYVTNLVELNEDDGVSFLASNTCANEPARLAAGAGQVRRATAIGDPRDVVRGLAAAMSSGSIHRGIKAITSAGSDVNPVLEADRRL